MEFLSNSFSFDWQQSVVEFFRIALAFVLAVPIGWERQKSERNLGLRTFPIVSMAACGYMLIGQTLVGADADTHARLIQGLIGGIGFIGGGAILKEGTSVRGMATASSIWGTGAIGGAVAYGREEIAIVLSLIMFVTLRVLTPVVTGSGELSRNSDDNSQSD